MIYTRFEAGKRSFGDCTKAADIAYMFGILIKL